MAENDAGTRATAARLPTGVAGLDAILGGGLFEGGLYVVEGVPGAGKTILANQIAFHQARRGRGVVYATLLGEAHDRMLQHLSGFEFTDVSLLPDPLFYLSVYGALDEEGVPGLLGVVRDTLRERGPALLVLDGLSVARDRVGSDVEFRRLLHVLQGEAALYGCTMLFLTNAPGAAAYGPEHTVVDGLIELHDDGVGARSVRSLVVRKFRGGAYLRGRHTFCIEDRGVVVYPRLETLVGREREEERAAAARERVTTGVAGLDRMLRGGGVPARSTTLVVGPSGAGKTTLGLLFVARSTPGEPGLLFGCHERPGELRLKAEAVGVDLDGLVAAGALRVLWHPPFDSCPDEMGHRLLEEVRRAGARRVFLDGARALELASVFPEQLSTVFAALSIQLRAAGATTVCSAEARAVAPHDVVAHEFLTGADNVVLLRFAEHRSRLLRLLSIVKVRHGGFDPAIVPFEIGGAGITLQEPIEGAEAIVRGQPVTPPSGRRSRSDHHRAGA